MKKEDIELDHRGYYRFKDSKRLCHRWVAEKYIWKNNRKKYPLPFEEYQVHHKDGKKRNNKPTNLELLTIREHELKHGKVRAEWMIVKILFILLCTMGVFNIVGFIMSDYKLSQNIRLLIVILILLLAFLIIYLTTKEKKGRKII